MTEGSAEQAAPSLTEFLLARIAEDEGVARAAAEYEGSSQWSYLAPASAVHQARHDPARVLADCEAKRRIVREHHPVDPCIGTFGPDGTPCATLHFLALPYADHPDYQEEWRP